MQLLERARNYEFLGREFLVWLWFKSDINEGRFSLGKSGDAELWFDGRVVLQSDQDSGAEKVICLGENSHLREARFALTEHKTITEAMFKLVIGDNEWSFILDSTWMNFKSFKTPKVMQDNEEDPEGLFYEKFSLIEQALSAIDIIYSSFIKVRLSPEWQALELPALLKWIREGK
jgi:recombination associated protein RdgC